MQSRVKKIYKELYSGIKKKSYLAEGLNVTTKTIENTISKYPEDIIMDRELGGYRFNILLPTKIPSNMFFKFFQDSINNPIIKNDFISLSESIASESEFDLLMFPTNVLSDFAQKIIMVNVAINSSCTLIMDYVGNRGELEMKYIKPHKVFVSASKYYIYASYIDENEKNIGEYRSFALNGIVDIKPFKYMKNEKFNIDHEFNAYGAITKEKYVTLHLKSVAANFFKKEGIFNQPDFEFVVENVDNSIIVKMYYVNIQQIVSLVQRWMPFIRVEGSISGDIYKIISDNYEKLSR